MVEISRMGHRCAPGATVNEKSRPQMHTAGQRPGFKTMWASSHTVLLAWQTLPFIVCLVEGRREQGRRNALKFLELRESKGNVFVEQVRTHVS